MADEAKTAKAEKTLALEFKRDYWPVATGVIATGPKGERILADGERIYAGEAAELPEVEAKTVVRADIATLAE